MTARLRIVEAVVVVDEIRREWRLEGDYPLTEEFLAEHQDLLRQKGAEVFSADKSKILLDDPTFWNSLWVSVLFTVASVTLHLVVAMPVALFLNGLRRGRTTLRLAFLTPWMVTPVLGAIAWVWLLDPHFGVANYLLRAVGAITENRIWLGEPGLALGSIIAVDVWRGFPFIMLILLAGLQTVPREEYEAASIDGAGTLQRFLYVTLPHLRYLLVVATTLDVINTVRTFDIVAVMTKGGPVNATEVLPVLIFNTAFQANRFGPAAAVGVVLLGLLLVFSTLYVLLLQSDRRERRA